MAESLKLRNMKFFNTTLGDLAVFLDVQQSLFLACNVTLSLAEAMELANRTVSRSAQKFFQQTQNMHSFYFQSNRSTQEAPVPPTQSLVKLQHVKTKKPKHREKQIMVRT